MPSIAVHIPDRLLSEIDRIVREQNISRNRFIIQACESALQNRAGHWPEGFFELDLSEEDLGILEEGVSEAEAAILEKRMNRKDSAL